MNKLNTERSREEGVKCDGMKEDSVEFSPIVYWKEPLPELLPLDLEGPSKPAQGEVKSQQPTLVKVNLKETSSTSKASLTASQDKKVEQMKWRSEVESVWLDKHRVEEAEAKYYGQKGGEQKKIVAQKKVASAPVTEVLKNVEVTKKAEKTENDDCEDDLTYEDHLEIIKSDNLEMKESLRTLTDVVLKLQERIKNLEDSNCNQLVRHDFLLNPANLCNPSLLCLSRAPRTKGLTWVTISVSAGSMMTVSVITIMKMNKI